MIVTLWLRTLDCGHILNNKPKIFLKSEMIKKHRGKDLATIFSCLFVYFVIVKISFQYSEIDIYLCLFSILKKKKQFGVYNRRDDKFEGVYSVKSLLFICRKLKYC